jgi:hypothetical protein
MAMSNMRCSLRRYFRPRPLRTTELQWIKRNKRLIVRDREVPRRTYVFEVIANATL